MPLQTTPLTYFLLLSSGASFVVGLYVAVRSFDHPARESARSFVWLAATTGLVSLAYSFRVLHPSVEEKFFWFRVTWVAVAFVGIAWPSFVFSYTGDTGWPRSRVFAALSIVPACSALFAVAGDQFRSLLVASHVVVVRGRGVALVEELTPLALVFVVYFAAGTSCPPPG